MAQRLHGDSAVQTSRVTDDRDLLAEAEQHVSRNRRFLAVPTGCFKKDRIDAHPVSLGITEPVQLFTDRQLAVFGCGFRWLEEAEASLDVRRALTLCLSNGHCQTH